MHRQTDRKTDRQKQTDYNNPLLSSSVNEHSSMNFFMWVGPDQGKIWKESVSYSEYKVISIFQLSHFQ